eukprot:TRINITY_DN787_c0_g1_i1.p1 TRINITY_DN787_c0_g1~~TRINITY_DN787_c0_g1_i1.p1  ORF type:complete len:827 (+),score=133.62 TRINITY_DN787_c0_g1_i1:2264-4744(+)
MCFEGETCLSNQSRSMLSKALIFGAFFASAVGQTVTKISGCHDVGANTLGCPTNVPLTFTITGTVLANPTSVTIGGRTCAVVTSAATSITCTYTGLAAQASLWDDAVQTNANPALPQAVSVQTSTGTSTGAFYATFSDVSFLTVAGKNTDPCNAATLTGHIPDCPATVQRPPSVVLLPAVTSQTSPAQVAISGPGLDIPITLSGVKANQPGWITIARLVNGVQTCSRVVAQANDAFLWPVSLVTNGAATFTIKPAFYSAATTGPDGTTYASLELEANPRQLCWIPSSVDPPLAAAPTTFSGRAIGAAIKVVWDCDPTVAQKACSNIPTDLTQYTSLTAQQKLIRKGQTTCCRKSTAEQYVVGQCINPNVQSCCGSSAYTVGTERCCNPGTTTGNEIVTTYSQACPCQKTNNGFTCPTGETCCVADKYPELGITSGVCYNPQTHKCCNTGERYDPGSQQCCRINGLQSLDVPCPCSTNDDCQLGGRTNFACCKQTSPALVEERNTNANIAGYTQPMCSIYQSYPTGSGATSAQRCPGSCINVDYQICCNGVACIKAFEKCCNATCCNQFVGSCNVAIRSATQGNQYNFNEFRVTYLQCTTVEHMHELKAFWVFVWPTFLLMMTLSTLALVIIFANKASGRSYSVLEQTIIAAALLAIIFSLSLFFSPLYKYGMVVIFAHLLAILTAGVRVRSLNVLTVLVFAILVIYLFDPFHGNAYLTLAENRNLDGSIDRETMGIWHATFRQWKTLDRTRTERWCTNYYNWFRLDDNLRDLDRFDNPLDTTWGYCNRGWVFALLMFEGFIILATLVNFVLGLVAVLVRFQEKAAY